MIKKVLFSQIFSIVLLTLIILLNSCSQATLTGQDPVKNDAGVTAGEANKSLMKVTDGVYYIFMPAISYEEHDGWAWESCVQTVMNYMDPTCHVTQTELYNLMINPAGYPTLGSKMIGAFQLYKGFHGWSAWYRYFSRSMDGRLPFFGNPPDYGIADYINQNRPIIIVRKYNANQSISYPLIVYGYNSLGTNPKVYTWDPHTHTAQAWNWNSFYSDSTTFWDDTVIPVYDPAYDKWWIQ